MFICTRGRSEQQVEQQRWYSRLSPGSVAAPVIQATGRLRLADRLSSGLLGCSGLCRSGVRTKFGIDMVLLGELGTTRSSKEGWTGPGRRRSRSKPPCRSVVGSRLRIDTAAQPERYSETQTFAFVSEWWYWKKRLEMDNMIMHSMIRIHSFQL